MTKIELPEHMKMSKKKQNRIDEKIKEQAKWFLKGARWGFVIVILLGLVQLVLTIFN